MTDTVRQITSFGSRLGVPVSAATAVSIAAIAAKVGIVGLFMALLPQDRRPLVAAAQGFVKRAGG